MFKYFTNEELREYINLVKQQPQTTGTKVVIEKAKAELTARIKG